MFTLNRFVTFVFFTCLKQYLALLKIAAKTTVRPNGIFAIKLN